MKFSDRFIAAQKPQEKKYLVREGRGFTLQVLPSGVKTFMFIYTVGGKRRYFNLGNYPAVSLADARQKFLDAAAAVERGEDPCNLRATSEAEEKEVADTSVRKIASDYLDKYSKKHHSPDWHKIVRLSIENDLIPTWGARPIESIRRREAIELLEHVATRGAGQAKNVLKAAQGVFEYAIQREYIEFSPFAKISRAVPEVRPSMKERVLSEKEIRHIWHAIDAGPGSAETKRALKLILVTGQRPGEVAEMHRDEIEGEWWTIPASRTKNGREHRVYLTPTALCLVGNDDGPIFPSPRDLRKPISRRAISNLVCSDRKEGNSTPAGKGGEERKERPERRGPKREVYYGLPEWTPHDLRRTARTMMAKIGVPDEVAEEILNHEKQGLKKVYNQYKYDPQKKEALLAWEAELLQIIQ